MSEKYLVPADIDIGTPSVDTSTSEAAATIQGDIAVPEGKQLLGVWIKLYLNVTEAGVVAGTNRVAPAIQKFSLRAKGDRDAIIINGGESLKFAAMGEFARQVHGIAPVPVFDVVMAASATAYWMYAYIVSPLPAGVRQVEWTCQLKSILSILAGTWSAPTGYIRQLWVSPLFTDKIMPAQRLEARYETNTRVTEKDVYLFGLGIDNVELSTVVTQASIGDVDVSATNLVKVKENLFNTKIAGYYTAFGTPTADIPVPGIITLNHATQRLFGIQHEVQKPGTLSIKCSSSALQWYVVKPWDAILE